MKTKEINSICKDMFRINGQLENIEDNITKTKDALLRGDSASSPFLTAILKVENLVIHLRKLANTILTNENPSLYDNMLDTVANAQYRITLQKIGSACRLTMPCLLPCNYNTGIKNVLAEPLCHFLQQYDKANKLPFYDKAVLVMVHHTSQPGNKIRDNDNYESKKIINILSSCFLPDDGYNRLVTMNATKPDKNDYTEIFIIPQDDFLEWVSKNSMRLFTSKTTEQSHTVE